MNMELLASEVQKNTCTYMIHYTEVTVIQTIPGVKLQPHSAEE